MFKEPQHFSSSLGKSFTRYSENRSFQQQPAFNKKKLVTAEMTTKSVPSKNDYSEKIKQMIQHVSRTIQQLLQNLQYLYQANGVNYKVDLYYDTLMRLLTPHELLSHFHILDNSHLFTDYSPMNLNTFSCKYKAKSDIQDEKLKVFQFKPKDKMQNKFNRSQQCVFIKSKQQRTQKQAQDKRLPSFRSTTVLGSELQQQLANWAVKQLMSHKLIRLQDISNRAREFTKQSQGFKSSLGWVTRFLHRHPYVHKMMRCLRRKDLVGVREQFNKYVSVSIDRERKGYYLEEPLTSQLNETTKIQSDQSNFSFQQVQSSRRTTKSQHQKSMSSQEQKIKLEQEQFEDLFSSSLKLSKQNLKAPIILSGPALEEQITPPQEPNYSIYEEQDQSLDNLSEISDKFTAKQPKINNPVSQSAENQDNPNIQQHD